MHTDFISHLCCPECRSGFDLETFAADEHIVEEGRLLCTGCAQWYRIEQGIADLLPLTLRRMDLYEAFARRHKLPVPAGGAADKSQKQRQIDFFLRSSQTYEGEITQSPYFSALDEVYFANWITRSIEPGASTLEIGCGSGRQTLPLAHAGSRVLGLDISEEMLRVTRAKAISEGVLPRIALVAGDAEAPPIADESFDVLVIVGALHHMESPEKALYAAARSLRPGGLFFAYDPHDSPLRFLFDWLMSICRLYEEEAGDDPLFREQQLQEYFQKARIQAEVLISTYLPPHAFYPFGPRINAALLRSTDFLGNLLPWTRRLGGMIISQGQKAER